MPEESKRTAFYIFLFLIFFFLAIFIFVFIYNTYTGTANYTTTTTQRSVECIGYAFRIIGGSMHYSNGLLNFIIEPVGGGKINTMIVSSGGSSSETKNVDFAYSYDQNVTVAINISDSFEIYPKGCSDNAKECSISSQSCTSK